jgi:hypothetical protein
MADEGSEQTWGRLGHRQNPEISLAAIYTRVNYRVNITRVK